MSFITFIYKFDNKKLFYGKYFCDYISDDHEGLDSEIKPILIDGINNYRKQKGQEELNEKIYIGILSFTTNKYIPIYSSDEEIQCFDFYHINFNHKRETYVNGKIIT
jgi:hypothetical protein